MGDFITSIREMSAIGSKIPFVLMKSPYNELPLAQETQDNLRMEFESFIRINLDSLSAILLQEPIKFLRLASTFPISNFEYHGG